MAKTISLTVAKMSLVQKRVKTLRHCAVPGWVADNHQCDKCHWEIEEKDTMVLAESKDGIMKLHESCYED